MKGHITKAVLIVFGISVLLSLSAPGGQAEEGGVQAGGTSGTETSRWDIGTRTSTAETGTKRP